MLARVVITMASLLSSLLAAAESDGLYFSLRSLHFLCLRGKWRGGGGVGEQGHLISF